MLTHLLTQSDVSSFTDSRADEPIPADWVCEAFGEILESQLEELTESFAEFVTPSSRRDALKSGR